MYCDNEKYNNRVVFTFFSHHAKYRHFKEIEPEQLVLTSPTLISIKPLFFLSCLAKRAWPPCIANSHIQCTIGHPDV